MNQSRHCLALCAVLLTTSLPAVAKDVEGVAVADTVTVAGQALKLNGAGLRSKSIFKVYVGSLYVATPSHDPAALLASDTPRRQVMHFLRDVDRAAIVAAWREGVAANAAHPSGDANVLKARLDNFFNLWRDMKQGEEAAMTYVPGEGLSLAINGKAVGKPIPGKDFADAVLNGWLGPKPPSDELKRGLLGK